MMALPTSGPPAAYMLAEIRISVLERISLIVFGVCIDMIHDDANIQACLML